MRFGWLTLGLSESPEGDFAAIHDVVEQACFAEATGIAYFFRTLKVCTRGSWRDRAAVDLGMESRG